MTSKSSPSPLRYLWLALALTLLPSGAQAQFRIPGFELIHNAPVETTLGSPDLRGPVEVWCEMFRNARRTIDMEQYYVAGQTGEPLDTVIGCMERAARRGVRIRFLMEERGQSNSAAPTIARLRAIVTIQVSGDASVGLYCPALRQTRTNVSWTASSASCSPPRIRSPNEKHCRW